MQNELVSHAMLGPLLRAGSTPKRERDDMLARLRDSGVCRRMRGGMLRSDCSCVQVCVARTMSFGRLLLLHAL